LASASTTGSPRWSPDGNQIVFDSRAEGNADIYVVSVDGGSPKRLTNDPTEDVVPSWSSNGRSIYFASRRTGRFEIWKMAASGGDATQVTGVGGFITMESADGKTLYFSHGRPDPGLWSISTMGGTESKVFDGNPGRNWGLAAKGIYFFSMPREELGPYSLEYFDFATRQTQRLAALQGPARLYTVNVMTISPDGRSIVYSQRDQLDFDVMLIENFH
jgi:Tol biopolymer transport system component